MGFIFMNLDAGTDDSEDAQALKRKPGKPASKTVAEEDKSYRLEKHKKDNEDGN
jgi:hypothetical protein